MFWILFTFLQKSVNSRWFLFSVFWSCVRVWSLHALRRWASILACFLIFCCDLLSVNCCVLFWESAARFWAKTRFSVRIELVFSVFCSGVVWISIKQWFACSVNWFGESLFQTRGWFFFCYHCDFWNSHFDDLIGICCCACVGLRVLTVVSLCSCSKLKGCTKLRGEKDAKSGFW